MNTDFLTTFISLFAAGMAAPFILRLARALVSTSFIINARARSLANACLAALVYVGLINIAFVLLARPFDLVSTGFLFVAFTVMEYFVPLKS